MPTENSVMNAWGNQGGNPTFGGNGGFDWGKASPMPNGNSVMDAWGKQGGNSMFSGNSEKPDNTMNITSQTIGNNYNGRIDGQVGGLGIPQSPQGGSGFNSVFNVANANPYQPSISSSNLARGIGGQNVSANDLSRYLGNEYNRAAWIQQDMANNGVTNPLISMLRYDTKVAPLINAAKEEELRNAFFTLNNPNASEQDRMNAMALIEFRKGDPFLEENFMAKLGYVPDDGYGGYSGYGGYGEDGGEYGGEDENARAIYNHLVNKGLPANVIAGIMGNLQAESGFNSSAVGDGGNSIGLAQWYAGRGDNLRNFAQQRGKEWNDIGTQLDFLLDEVAKGNPELLNRMANLSPHEAAILFHDEFEKSADTPEMKARRGDYATDIYNGRRQGNGGTRRGRWKQNPYKMTPMQRMQYAHDLKMGEIEARNRYRNTKDRTTVDTDGYIKGSGKRNNALINGINWYANSSDKKPEDLMKNVVDPMADVFVDKLVQFKNEDAALEQLAYDLVGGERFGSSGMSDEQLAEVIGEAAMKAGNNERIRYQTSGKNAIKQKLINDILPRLHGYKTTANPPSVGGQKPSGNNDNIKSPSNKNGSGAGNASKEKSPSAWESAFNAVSNIPNAIRGIAKNDKAIG